MSSGIALLVASIVGIGRCNDDVVQLVQKATLVNQGLQEKLLLEKGDQVAPQLSAFRHFDTDGSGGLNLTELEAFLSIRSVPKPRWEAADMDGSGDLDYDEFMDCVVNPAACYPVPSGVSLGRPSPDTIDMERVQRKVEQRMEDLESFGLEDEDAVRAARSNATVLRLHLMPKHGLQSPIGAVCLDGSDAGFYFAPASTVEAKDKWIITFDGGAWCSTEEQCADRVGTDKGSSRFFRKEIFPGGLMSDNCTVNPTFCDFNRVKVAYCDGTSFTGDRHDPVPVPGSNPPQQLFFRGRRILDAVLNSLFFDFGLSDARQVLLSGVSAGGVAVLAAADHLRERLEAGAPALDKVRVVPLSGFFLEEKSVEGFPVFPDLMQRVVKLANSTHALNRRCLEKAPDGQRWKCILAEYSHHWTETPTFIVNSALDWWASENVNYPSAEGSVGMSHSGLHADCANNVERCTPFEMFAMNQFIRDFVSSLSSSLGRRGNGAFVHSCHLHAEGTLSQYWSRIELHGVTMQQAVLHWWQNDGLPSELHTYRPCTYGQGGTTGTDWPYQCNPTCIQTE